MSESDLKQYQAIVREMIQVQDKIKELEHMKYSIKSPKWSDMPRGGFGDHDKIGNILVDIEEQIEKYKTPRKMVDFNMISIRNMHGEIKG